MKVTFTCSGKDEDDNWVELELIVENDPSSAFEFFNFCKLCKSKNLKDISLQYSFEGNKNVYILGFCHPYKEPKKTFLEWLKSLFK